MKPRRKEECDFVNPEKILHDLDSPNAAERMLAVRAVCPCRMGWDIFEQYVSRILALCSDPDPAVSLAAAEVIKEAYELSGEGMPTSRTQVKDNLLAARIRTRHRPEIGDDAERGRLSPRRGATRLKSR